MNPLELRDATHDDLDVLLDIVTRAYRGGDGVAGWTTESQYLGGQRTDPESLRAEIDDPNGRLIVAHGADGSILGCIKVDRRGDAAHFGLFAVDPRLQGGGLGGRLLAAVDEQARSWGCTRVVMEVLNVRTDIKAWYERKGFRPTGNTIPFPYDDERFGLPRRDDLQFDEYAKPLD